MNNTSILHSCIRGNNFFTNVFSRLHSRIRGILFLMIILASCSYQPTLVDINDPLLKKEKGNFYFDGELYSGTIQEKSANENLMSEMQIVEGKKQGISKKWWPNGNLKSESNFENGDYHGTVKQFYENGKPFSVFNYNHGHESGLQQMWKSDGRLKVNYEVINGRKYGLTGVKNCVNVFEEEEHE